MSGFRGLGCFRDLGVLGCRALRLMVTGFSRSV